MGTTLNSTQPDALPQPTSASAGLPPSAPLPTGAGPQTLSLEKIADAYIQCSKIYQQPGNLTESSSVPSTSEARKAWFELARELGSTTDRAAIITKLRAMQQERQGESKPLTLSDNKDENEKLLKDLGGIFQFKPGVTKQSWGSLVNGISELSRTTAVTGLGSLTVWEKLKFASAFSAGEIDKMLNTAYGITGTIRPSQDKSSWKLPSLPQGGGNSNSPESGKGGSTYTDPTRDPNQLDPNHREVKGYRVGNGVGQVRVNVGLPSEGGIFGIGAHQKTSTQGLVVTTVDKALQGKIKPGWVITEYGLVDDAGKKVKLDGGPEENAAAYERFRQFQRVYRDKRAYVVVKDPENPSAPPAKIPYTLTKEQRTGFGFTGIEQVQVPGQPAALKVTGMLPNNSPAAMLPKDFFITQATLKPRVQGEKEIPMPVAYEAEFRRLLEQSKDRKLEVKGWQVVNGERKRVSFLLEPKAGYYDFDISQDQRGRDEKNPKDLRPLPPGRPWKPDPYGKAGGNGEVPFKVEMPTSGIWPFNQRDDPGIGLQISQLRNRNIGLGGTEVILAYGLEGGPIIDFRKNMDHTKDGRPDRQDYAAFEDLVSQNPGKKLKIVVQSAISGPGGTRAEPRTLLVDIQNVPVNKK
jgi:hypothetical protein